MTKTKKNNLLMWIFYILVYAVSLVLLELNKNTLLGWGAGLLLLAGYLFLRRKVLQNRKGILRILAFLVLIAALTGVLLFSVGPVRMYPAVEGKNGGVTDIVTVKDGQLTGVYTEDRAVEVYAGIPYAAPPVGDLRWRERKFGRAWFCVIV